MSQKMHNNVDEITKDHADAIQTHTGKYWSVHQMGVHNYDIRDIAHALSLTCRYNGHCNFFYSVAEHCCKISDYVSKDAKLFGLLHDASEAYLGDIPKPIKKHCEDYLKMEKRLEDFIFSSFLKGVQYTDEIVKKVKAVDKRIVNNEMLVLMPVNSLKSARIQKALNGIEIECWDPRRAELEFLERYKELTSD